MKVSTKNTTALFLAFLVLFSTMSFTINEHYCGDSLINTTVFAQAKTCGMDNYPSQINAKTVNTNDDCCNTQHILKEGEDELSITVNSISFEQQFFVASFVYTYLKVFENLDIKDFSFKNYSPPLVHKDLQIDLQRYLI